MKQQTVRYIISAAAYIGLAIDIGTVALVVPAWTGHPVTGVFVTTTATALMIATLALQMTFVIVQMFPNGRAMVAVPGLGHDGWLYVIISTAIPGVLWHNLASMAVPFMRLIMPGFTTPLILCLLLLIGRVTQQRRISAMAKPT